MIKFAAFVVLVSVRIMYQPTPSAPAFANPSVIAEQKPEITGFKGHVINDKVILQWAASENASVNLFEVEKSSDGKNFKTAGIVFGTDEARNNSYEFFVRKNKPQYCYRLKMVDKDKQSSYSSIVVIRKA